MKRTVKSALILLLAAVLLCGNALAAPAGTYAVDALNLELTVPEGYYVFDVNTVEKDPDLSAFGIDGAQMAQTLKLQNIYVDIVPKDLNWELCLIMTEGEEYQPVFDFNLFGGKFFEKMMEEISAEFEKMGFAIQGWSEWQEGQAKFLIIDYTQTVQGSEVLRKQFYTIYNGQAINLTLIVPGGLITEEMKELQETVAKSIRFTKTFDPPQEALDAAKAYEKTESSILVTGLKGALIGAVIGGLGYTVFHWLRKKRKKKDCEEAPALENEVSTGGTDL